LCLSLFDRTATIWRAFVEPSIRGIALNRRNASVIAVRDNRDVAADPSSMSVARWKTEQEGAPRKPLAADPIFEPGRLSSRVPSANDHIAALEKKHRPIEALIPRWPGTRSNLRMIDWNKGTSVDNWVYQHACERVSRRLQCFRRVALLRSPATVKPRRVCPPIELEPCH
jgi:hypothetical protein